MDEIRRQHVSDYCQAMIDAGRAHNTAKRHLTFLNAVSKYADNRYGLYEERRNPVVSYFEMGVLRGGKATINPFTVEEIDAYLAAALERAARATGRHARALARRCTLLDVVLLDTGLRIGEALAPAVERHRLRREAPTHRRVVQRGSGGNHAQHRPGVPQR